jgi:hypothetical protein
MINLKNFLQMILLHPHKVLIRIIMKKKMNTMIKFKRRAMIKGETRMMAIMEKHHHIQECATMFKEITLLTTISAHKTSISCANMQSKCME